MRGPDAENKDRPAAVSPIFELLKRYLLSGQMRGASADAVQFSGPRKVRIGNANGRAIVLANSVFAIGQARIAAPDPRMVSVGKPAPSLRRGGAGRNSESDKNENKSHVRAPYPCSAARTDGGPTSSSSVDRNWNIVNGFRNSGTSMWRRSKG